MREIRNENYDKVSLTDPTFWSGEVRFINCSFCNAYIGASFRENKKAKSFDLSKVVFDECNFQNCNFKGAKGLKARNFINPQNIATTYHLPPGVIKAFDGTECSYEEKLRTSYDQSSVINHKIKGSKRIRSITEFFTPQKEVKAQHETDLIPNTVLSSSSIQ